MVTNVNNQSNYLLKLEYRGGNTRNNRNLAAARTESKDSKREVDMFGSMLVLRYLRVDPKRSFDIFPKKIIDYDIKDINNSEDVLMLMQYLKYPKSMFNFKKKLNDPESWEEKSEVNKPKFSTSLNLILLQ